MAQVFLKTKFSGAGGAERRCRRRRCGGWFQRVFIWCVFQSSSSHNAVRGDGSFIVAGCFLLSPYAVILKDLSFQKCELTAPDPRPSPCLFCSLLYLNTPSSPASSWVWGAEVCFLPLKLKPCLCTASGKTPHPGCLFTLLFKFFAFFLPYLPLALSCHFLGEPGDLSVSSS